MSEENKQYAKDIVKNLIDYIRRNFGTNENYNKFINEFHLEKKDSITFDLFKTGVKTFLSPYVSGLDEFISDKCKPYNIKLTDEQMKVIKEYLELMIIISE